MRRSFAILVLISVLIVACGITSSWNLFHSHTLPFSVNVVNANTAVVNPNPGYSLPPGISVGDHIDLPALDQATRAAIAIQGLQGLLPAGETYQFILRRGAQNVTVPVTTAPNGMSQRERIAQWVFCANYAIFAILALLMLWRGRGRAARYFATWLTLTIFGFACNYGFGFDGQDQVDLFFSADGKVQGALNGEYFSGALDESAALELQKWMAKWGHLEMEKSKGR